METVRDGEMAVEPGTLEAADPGAADGALLRAAIAATVAALLGAVAWAVIAYATGYAIGYLALLIGIIVGYAVRRFGQNGGRKYQIMGAAFSAFGWALGTWLCDIAYLANATGESYLGVLGSVGVGSSLVLAVRTAQGMDLVFLLIAIYEGYKFSGPRRRGRAR